MGGWAAAINGQATEARAIALTATASLAGAIPQIGCYTLGSAGAITITLQTPVSGSQDSGGDDGKIAIFNVLTAQAHIVQTAANKIQTNKTTCTFTAAIGNFVALVAQGGFWWPFGNLNGTLA